MLQTLRGELRIEVWIFKQHRRRDIEKRGDLIDLRNLNPALASQNHREPLTTMPNSLRQFRLCGAHLGQAPPDLLSEVIESTACQCVRPTIA